MTPCVVFLDTNVLVYAFSDDPKMPTARRLLDNGFIGSVQGLNELSHVVRKRFGWPWEEIGLATSSIQALAKQMVPTLLEDHRGSLHLAQRYQLSVYDALMLAIALRAGCTVFYSEDMHHGLVVDDRMTVLNPFR